MENFTDFVAWASFVFGAFVIGVSIVVLTYYLRQRLFWHIGLITLSYATLSVLMILTINYRIFYSGLPRFLGTIALLFAIVEGAIGLTALWWKVTDASNEN